MTYVGQQPATTFDSGIQDRFTGLTTNTVTLNHEISAEEDILVVWNNIVQDKNTYSVGGTGNKTVTLGGTLVSADVVTVYYLNKVMQSVNPTAGSVNTTQLADLGVTGAKLNTDVISAQTALGATPADTDELLVSDAGVLKRVDYSHLKSSGGTESFYVSKTGSADQTLTNQTYTKMTFDSEGVDAGSNFASDKYTVPSAGKYFFEAQVKGQSSTDAKIQIFVTAIYKNGSMVVRNHNELTTGYEKMISKNVSIILDLAASDYIEVYCYLGQASSTTLTVAGDSYGATHFLGYKLA